MAFSVVNVALGTVLEIPLPGLAGRYFLEDVYQRDTSFELPLPPTTVNGAFLRLVGTATIRFTWCDPQPSDLYAQSFIFHGALPDYTTGGSGWVDLGMVENGPFEITAPMTTRSGASWAFLETGTGHIYISGSGCPILDGCWPVTDCSEVFVEEAYFVLDAEFPIPVDGSTWGRIKALYEGNE